MTSPVKFVKPAELFKMRRAKKPDNKFDITSQSPLKCLKDPSPIKNIPIVLKNPFRGRSVKRPLSFDSSNSPIKRASCSNSSSPKKKPRLNLEMDEDANMEAPQCNSNGFSYCDSDFDDDDEDEENDKDASRFLESIGLTVSRQDFGSLDKFKPKVKSE